MYASAHASAVPAVPVARPGRVVTAVGWLSALWCVGFATVNVVLELTGHFAANQYSAYASGLSVMDWLVVVLKLVGAGLALLSISRRQVLPVGLLGMLLWGGFATLAVYATGNVVEAVGILSGLMEPVQPLRPLWDLGYVSFFAAAATGFGVLAISYARRSGLRRLPITLGVLGAPALIAGVLVVVPLLLTSAGLFPS